MEMVYLLENINSNEDWLAYCEHTYNSINELAKVYVEHNEGVSFDFAVNFALFYRQDEISRVKLNNLCSFYNCSEKEILNDPVKFPEYYKSNVVNDSNRGVDEKGRPLFYFT